MRFIPGGNELERGHLAIHLDCPFDRRHRVIKVGITLEPFDGCVSSRPSQPGNCNSDYAMSTLKASARNCAFSDSVIAVVLNSDISNSVRGGPVKISPTSSDSALY